MRITKTTMLVAELTELPVFSLAGKFKKLPDNEMMELAQDIHDNGLRFPILVWEDQVLDGRNRLEALQKTSLTEVPVEILDGTEYEAACMVFSVNILRRHMNDGQRAMMALEFLPYEEEEAKRRQQAAAIQTNVSLGRSPETLGEPGATSADETRKGGRARDIVAEKANVSGRYLQTAKRVTENAPDLAQKVLDDNDYSLKKAEQELKARSEDRDKKLSALEVEKPSAREFLRKFESGEMTLDEACIALKYREAEEARAKREANPEALIMIEQISENTVVRLREFNLKIGKQMKTTVLVDQALDLITVLEKELETTKSALSRQYDLLEEAT